MKTNFIKLFRDSDSGDSSGGFLNKLPLILGGLQTGLGLFQAFKSGQIKPEYRDMLEKNLGVAQNLYGGRMAGALNAEKNIATAQANVNASGQRNATDAAQLLALSSAAQGNANQAYNDLASKEAQNKYAMAENLSRAYQAYQQGMMNKYQMDSQAKLATNQAAFGNMFGGLNAAASYNYMKEAQGNQNKYNQQLLDLYKSNNANNNVPQAALPPLTTPTQTSITNLPPLTQESQGGGQNLPPLVSDENTNNDYWNYPTKGGLLRGSYFKKY